jgi:small-conductance mechanosensitive channel
MSLPTDLAVIQQYAIDLVTYVFMWLSSPTFYAQCAFVIVAVALAYIVGRFIVSSLLVRKVADIADDSVMRGVKQWLYDADDLIKLLVNVVALAIAIEISLAVVQQDGLIRFAQGVAMAFFCRALITRYVVNGLLKTFFKWTVLPMVILYVVGWLERTVSYLDSVSLGVGNIEFSLYGIFRAVFFGLILFWLGRASNNAGQQFIRQREDIDIGTKEVFAKLFEVLLIIIVFFILLQIIGINLTTLAVFGGAVGVGLGFGLQAIASNFISGIILLLDRSLLVGDYIELEDGRKGVIRKLSMRCATLETYDGKDIVVPNEKFITSSFTNWTHKDIKQRYSLEFQVAYKTDLHALFPLLRETVANHPQVISGEGVPVEEQPDAEISGFGDSGVSILIEYWMEGIDDGKNRVGADLLLMIWDTLKEHVVEIPYPQRDIRMVEGGVKAGK